MGGFAKQHGKKLNIKINEHSQNKQKGLLRWEASRADWLSLKQQQQQQQPLTNTTNMNTSTSSSSETIIQQRQKLEEQQRQRRKELQLRAVPLEVDEIIDVIFSPRWRNPNLPLEEIAGPPRRFPTNVPLPQMVDVLVDLWEAEGLDI